MALVVFDLTNEQSFEDLKMWISDCKKICNPETEIVVIGNKMDLEDERKISQERARMFAKINGASYYETSAKLGVNVAKVFLDTAEKVHRKIKQGIIDPRD